MAAKNEASSAKDAVFVKSVELSRDEHPVVSGPDFITLLPSKNTTSEKEREILKNEAILRAVASLGTIGFQATNLARASQEIFYMLHGRKTFADRKHLGTVPPELAAQGKDAKLPKKSYNFSEEEPKPTLEQFYQVDASLFDSRIWRRPATKADEEDPMAPNELGLPEHCTIFLGCTSNLFVTMVRDTICSLAKDRLFDILVVSGGAFEIDLQRALDPKSVTEGSFINSNNNNDPRDHYQYGNIRVAKHAPNYEAFLAENIPKVLFEGAGRLEEDIQEDRDKLEDCPHRREEESKIVVLTPEQFWTRLARLLPLEARERSALWQCVDNGIAIYSPSLADGSIWYHLKQYVVSPTEGRPRLSIDLVRDITKLNKSAVKAKRTGMIILGGGVVKHHICNANLMRNGADHSVFINSAQEFDGSDAGARPDEAISWGKIKQGSSAVKVYSEVAAVFPLLSKMTFGEVLLRRQFLKK